MVYNADLNFQASAFDADKSDANSDENNAAQAILEKIRPVIESLIEDDTIKILVRGRNYDKRNGDSSDAPYAFMSHAKRIFQPDFKPSDDDILQCRIKTIGLTQVNFTLNSIRYNLIDVGGQRSERRKWITCFAGVTAVMFCVALSGYDQTLSEDRTVNRMGEAFKLYNSVSNNVWFRTTPIITESDVRL